jgi:hypothetical protein
VPWAVVIHAEFEPELRRLAPAVRRELLAQAQMLEVFGPGLGRPKVDTLSSSRYANMKELRFKADNGVWRAAFAFDPKQQAIILVAGDKAGVSQQRFYRQLIARADARYTAHLARLKIGKRT